MITIHSIVIRTKYVIYQKRKYGEQMCLSDVKRSIFKNLHIMRSYELMQMISQHLMKSGNFSLIVSGLTLPQNIVGIQYKTFIK